MGFVSLRYFIIESSGMLAGTESAWIGANDLVKEGTFVWAGGPEAGQNVNSIYINWGSGEPSDSGGEDCAEIPLSNGRWNDRKCDDPLRSVIEYSCSSGQEFGSTACQSTWPSCV